MKSILADNTLTGENQNKLLGESLKGYSDGAIKAALAQQQLKKEQVEAILISKKYQGELLRTTTDEWANISSTNALSRAQQTATSSTTSFGLAMKGLWNTITSFASAHPVLLTIMAVVGVLSVASKFTARLSNENEKLDKRIQKTSESFSEASSKLDEINSKLEENKKRIEELNKSEKPTYVDEQELEKLREETKLLEKQKTIVEATKKQSAEDKNDELYEKFRREYLTNDARNEDLTKSDGVLDIVTFKGLRGFMTATTNRDSKDDELQNALLTGESLYNLSNFSEDELKKYNELITQRLNLKYNPHSLDSEYVKELDEEIEKMGISADDALSIGVIENILDLDEKIKSHNKILNKKSDELLEELSKYNETDPNYQSEGAQEILKRLMAIYKYTNTDNWINDSINEVLDNDIFSSTIKQINDKIKNGETISYENLISDDSYNSLIEAISQKLFNSTDDESFKKAASYLAEHFVSNLDEIKEGIMSTDFINIFNSADFADTKGKLLDLAKSGEITPEVLESTEEYKTLLDKTGLSADEAKNKIINMLNSQEKLAAASQGLGKLKSAYEEFKNEDIGFVTAETLEALPDVFKNLKEFDLFSQIVGDPTQGEERIQQAFNNLVTEYLKTQGTLSGLSDAPESEINSYIANIKQMGITNADEFINGARQSLSKNEELLKAAETEYIDYLKNKEKYDKNYLTNIATKNGQLLNSLGSEYQNDYDNWCNLISKKSEAYDKFVTALGKSANNIMSSLYTDGDESAYANAKRIVENSKKYGATNIPSNRGFGKLSGIGFPTLDLNSEYYTLEQVLAAKDFIKQYEECKAMMDALTLDLSTLDLDFGGPLYFDNTSDSDNNSNKSEKSSQTFDWIEIKINNLTDALNRLKDASDDTYSSWTDRSTALVNAINTTRQAIDLQQQAYDRYMQEAEKSGLPDIYKNLIQNGAIGIFDTEDDDLKEQISDYQNWYDKAKNCLDVQKDLIDSLNELNNKKFDNIQSIFDFDNSNIEHSLTMLNSQIDKLEMKGLFANESYYNQMLQYTQKKISSLTNERKQLADIMNSSALSHDSEAWQNMYSTLSEIDEQISDLNKDLIEFNNNIRDLNWEIFEYLEDSITRITDETDYLINLLKDKDLFDDNGNFNKYADATVGLHATAYDTYKQQAQDYLEEMQDLQKQLVNGAGKDVLEQYNEMVDAHRDAINAANDEKQAILDLIEDGYNAQSDALQKLIDKKKEQMNAEKNLYDYQKTIKEKTDNISSLEKQKFAYEDDDSEEAISKIQQIKVQLEEAKADLKETEYEQYLSDTEDMLDKLSDDYEEWMNARLDNEDTLLAEIIGTVAGKSDEIKATLNEVADEYGTKISDSITSVFNAASPFTAALTNGLNNVSNSIAGTTAAIDRLIAQVAGITDADAGRTNAGSKTSGNTNSNYVSSASGLAGIKNTASSNGHSDNTSAGSSNVNNNSDNIFIHKTDTYPKNKLNIETSIVDRLKYYNFDSSFAARTSYYSKLGGSGTYTGSAAQNTWLIQKMKSMGYKKGTKNASAGLHWTQEDGEEIIIRKSDGAVLTQLNKGDLVLDNESSQTLWEFSQDPGAFMKKFGLSNLTPQINVAAIPLPDFNRIENTQNSQHMNFGDININLEFPNVNDYKDFRNKLIKDDIIEKAMFASINHAMTGKGTCLDKMKYIQ